MSDHVTRSDDKAERVRRVIREHLAALRDALGQFEQTTHGSLGLGEPNIGTVADRLVKAWNDPTAHNISEIDQQIGYLLKGWAKTSSSSGFTTFPGHGCELCGSLTCRGGCFK